LNSITVSHYGVSVTVDIPGETTVDELVPVFVGIGIILGYSPETMQEIFNVEL